jgi:hypothetical protein
MWFLFHRKEGMRAVPGGEAFTEECPTCQQRTRFVEVEISEKYGVWFVDVVKDEERAFRCTKCGDVFDLRDSAPAETPPPVAKPTPAKPAPAKPPVDTAAVKKKIDDELAELKKRMGR